MSGLMWHGMPVEQLGRESMIEAIHFLDKENSTLLKQLQPGGVTYIPRDRRADYTILFLFVTAAIFAAAFLTAIAYIGIRGCV